jgi:predicted SAM-dependent methyltransferase
MAVLLFSGETSLEGYINIDQPLASHLMQGADVADVHADILSLYYPAGSVDEIRLHHVFEHFPRPIACALLASWFSWLKAGGKIWIEVPDFGRTAWSILNPFASFKKKGVAERHIFGSHEAEWAVHCEGYTPASLRKFMEMYGFKVFQIKKNKWKGTYNFEIIANKLYSELTKKDFVLVTEGYLRNFLVDESDSERKLLTIWMDIFNQQIEKSWANKC